VSCARRERLESTVCVDASVALRLVLAEPGQAQANAQWESWLGAGTRLVSPYLFAFETTASLRKLVHRNALAPEAAKKAHAIVRSFPVELLHPEGIEDEAFALATDLGLATAYDSFYLALARKLVCEVWTADASLHRSVGRRFAPLRLLPGTGPVTR